MTTKEELLRATRDRVNDYKQTVNAILAFAAFVVHDGKSQRPNSEFGFGRRMTTSPFNPKSPSTEITPDLVVQKSEKYGVVAEAKKSLVQNQSNWAVHVEQLRKYDDDLVGWWTEDKKITHSDAVMLIHQSRGRQFARFLQNQKDTVPDSVGPNTCVVEFNESEETVTYYFFRLEFGSIPDVELGQVLYDGVQVPLDKLRMSFPNIRYYDAEPPMPLLLTDLWTNVFSAMKEFGKYDEKARATKIQISVSDVTDELQRAFGSAALRRDDRAGEFPKQKWVREAFERLVKYKLATPASGEDGKYIIYYKSFKDDVLDRFVKLEVEKIEGKEITVSEDQMKIFPNLDEH